MVKKKSNEELKPLNSVIQVCPICGKIDVYKDDEHDCFAEAQSQVNNDYYD